jgi:lysozyme
MNLESQLIRDEGNIPYAYQDHLSFWTVGVGFLIDKRKNAGLYPEEIQFILTNRINKNKAAITKRIPWFERLEPVRQGVILNMAYQLGVDGVLGFKKFIAAVERGDYEKASVEMLDSLWADQTPARAKRLSVQMKIGVWQ